MPRLDVVEDALKSLVGLDTIASAVLGTEDGAFLAVSPQPVDSWESSAVAEWATQQLRKASVFRQQVGEEEFSVLFDPKDGSPELHCHVRSVGHHVLLLLFRDRQHWGRVRAHGQSIAERFGQMLLES